MLLLLLVLRRREIYEIFSIALPVYACTCEITQLALSLAIYLVAFAYPKKKKKRREPTQRKINRVYEFCVREFSANKMAGVSHHQ